MRDDHLQELCIKLEPLLSLIPTDVKLLCEQVAYPDEILVVATLFVLVKTEHPSRLNLVIKTLEVKWFVENDPQKLRSCVLDWLAENRDFPNRHIVPSILIRCDRGGEVVYLPNDMPVEYKCYTDTHVFREVFK